MSALEECPLCDEIPEVSKYGIGIGQDAARCSNVNCSMHTAGFIYLETWNTRPIESALQARIAELTMPEDVREMTILALKEAIATLWYDENVVDGQRALDWLKGAK